MSPAVFHSVLTQAVWAAMRVATGSEGYASVPGGRGADKIEPEGVSHRMCPATTR